MEKLQVLTLLFLIGTFASTATAARYGNINTPCDPYRDRYGKQPNIIYIMADDMGWNDVGFHNPKLNTPNIDALRDKGIELTQSYVQPICSPTRSSFMTGKYPSNNGLHLAVIFANSQSCLPIEHKTIFEYMKDEGYSTKYIGKWHLGYCNETCLPNNRGVDEFRGVYAGDVTYFNWTNSGLLHRRINGDPSDENVGTHLTVQDKNDAEEMIMAQKGKNDPFFMWITPNTPHAPLEVTEEMFNSHPFLDENDEDEKQRREYLGLIKAFDDLIGGTMDALKRARLDKNTIIVLSSDNGGEALPTESPGFAAYANNYPLRLGKYSFTEGGVRTPTVYYDPRLRLNTRGATRDFMIHVSDWLPTFVQLGSKNQKTSDFSIPGIDGKSQVANLGSRYNNPDERRYNIREEMLVALTIIASDEVLCATRDAAYRWKDYKLIYGYEYYITDPSTIPSEWPKPQESPELANITGASCHRVENEERVVRCLFNVRDDPSETINLYDSEHEIVQMLIEKINLAKREAVIPVYNPDLEVSNVTAEVFGDYLIPRTDYCDPAVHSPLVANNPSCW